MDRGACWCMRADHLGAMMAEPASRGTALVCSRPNAPLAISSYVLGPFRSLLPFQATSFVKTLTESVVRTIRGWTKLFLVYGLETFEVHRTLII